MSATSTSRIEQRRAQRRSEILDAAWEIANEDGLAGLSLRSLAARVGVRAPSLYAHFDSKDAIYDGMFASGFEEFRDRVRALPGVDEVGPHELLAAGAHLMVEFANEEPARFTLLFQHAVPGWRPSAESYAVAVDVLVELAQELSGIGIDDPAAVDQWTAIVTGLASQQLANDPGGDRWERLVDDVAAMFLAWHRPDLTRPARPSASPPTDGQHQDRPAHQRSI